MIRLIRALPALLLVFPVALRADPAPRINWTKHFTRLGYERIELRRTADNHLYLTGKVNSRRRSVLVDTGWSFTTISTNTARGLPLSQGGMSGQSAVMLEHLRLGGVSFSNQLAHVQHLLFGDQVAPFEVVLGCDFLRHTFAIIDCPQRRLYVRRGAPTEQEVNLLEDILREGGFAEVPLKLKNPLAITCVARINGKPVEMLVDSGAVWSSLDLRQLDRLGLRALPSLAKITGVGATGTRGGAGGEAKLFALGDVPMKDANFALMDLSAWGLAATGKDLSEVQGILGGNELAANGAMIDCHRLKLWVRRGGAKP